jgi:hypothetical protein
MEKFLDLVAARLLFDDLPLNRRPVKPNSFVSLGLLLAPAVCFLGVLWLFKRMSPRFAWVNDVSRYPWQFWAIGLFGIIATLGGAGDWLFHKVYVTVGPKEHHSHLLALATGGVVFLLMAAASVVDQPLLWLLPIITVLLVTVTLICYDEFAFHIRRCKPFETRLHRMLVLGNGAAFLCWLHWIFVSGVR